MYDLHQKILKSMQKGTFVPGVYLEAVG